MRKRLILLFCILGVQSASIKAADREPVIYVNAWQFLDNNNNPDFNMLKTGPFFAHVLARFAELHQARIVLVCNGFSKSDRAWLDDQINAYIDNEHQWYGGVLFITPRAVKEMGGDYYKSINPLFLSDRAREFSILYPPPVMPPDMNANDRPF